MAALNKAEQAFMEEAVVLARQLGRPFGEKEVLFHALREGYELHLAFDNRFRKVAPRNGNVPAQWVLDEDPERLKNEAMADFFIGMKLYVRRRIDLAQIYASEICNREQLLPWGQRHNKRDLIKELLQEQGWELTDKQVEQIALGLVIKENEND